MKQCESLCPKCGSDNINWGEREEDGNQFWQNAVCQECGCEFAEIYLYAGTDVAGD